MNLLLDIGNTNLRWACQTGPDLGEIGNVRHGDAVPLDLLAAWESLGVPERVLVGNVGGESVAGAVSRVVRALWGLDAELVRVRPHCLGVRVAYEDPSMYLHRFQARGAASPEVVALIAPAPAAAKADRLHEGPIHVLDGHPTDPDILLSASYDGTILWWDLRVCTPTKMLSRCEPWPHCLHCWGRTA